MSSSSFATPTERLAAFFDSPPRPVWEDRDIDEIALLLEQCEHVASVCPRTYILFRTIGCVDTLEQLVKVGFGDQFFPVDSRSLPSFLEPSVRSAVVQHQGIILTKSLDLENGRHRHFTPSEALPFEILGRLGSGGYGQVDRIRSKTSFKLYALKRIRRRAAFGNASSREAVKGFLNEMKIMRGLEHRHVVRYIGSYTDKSHLGLVMSPVADSDLAAYNERLCGYYQVVQAPGFTSTVREGIWSLLSSVSSLQLQDQPVALEMSSNLRTYFGCLTAALAYLHDQNIRHKDIKPQNILICKGNILFADFGLSRDFADDVGSTTSGLTPASPRYSAPEVATYEARNTSSDIWSLGCVFIEMTAALHGLNVDRIKDFYARSGSRSVHFHSNPSATGEFIKELKNTARPTDKPTLLWIGQMLFLERNARPTAAHVLEMITSSEDNDTDSTANMFCGICCVPDFESDSMDSLADDFDVVTTVRQPDPDAQPHSVAKDTFQAVSDALPVGPPSLETTTGTEIEAPTSFPEAAHNAPGISSRTSPSEETLVTETTHAKAVDPDHGLDESNLQESPGQVQSPALRSIDDMEYHVAEPKANEQARMVISPHNFKLTATGNLDDSLSAAPKLRERVEYQTSWYANQNNRPLEPGNSPATFTQEAPNSGLLLDANTASGAMIPAVPEIGSSSNPYTASTYHSQIGRAIGDGGESILGLKTAYENARQERKAIPQRVFGVPLHLSIEYAYINLTQYPTFVGGYINGPIPIVIARCCEMTRSSLIMERALSDLMTPLEDKSLRSIFDSPDYGRDYDWIDYRPSDYISVLFEYLHSLPEPLLPHQASTQFRMIWRRVAGTGERAVAMRSTLQDRNVPAVNSNLILFLLNFFAVAMDQPDRPGHLAKELHPYFLGLDADFDNGQRDNSDIVTFMIEHAREILLPTTVANAQQTWKPHHWHLTAPTPQQYPAPTITATIPGRVSHTRRESLVATSATKTSSIDTSDPSWEPLLKELRAMGITDDQIQENADFITSYVNREKELKKDTIRTGKSPGDEGFCDSTGMSNVSYGPPPLSRSKLVKQATTIPRRHAIMKQLRKQGYTDRDFEVYSQYLDDYVEQEERGGHHDVFGTPIWISMRYAKARRSVKQDFNLVHNFSGTVPIVIAECCTYISKCNLGDGHVDLSNFSNVPLQGQEHIGAVVSIFESSPSYGAGLGYNSWEVSQAATLLIYYLQSLPQQIIPSDVAGKLVRLDTLPPRTDFTVSKHHPMLKSYLAELQELPRPNRDTLFYLLGFFLGLRCKSVVNIVLDLAHIFQTVIGLSDTISGHGYGKIAHFIIENAEHLLAAQVLAEQGQAEQIRVASVGSPPETTPVLVKAIYSHDEQNGGQPGDLFFRKGDLIRITKKPGNNDDWCTGELNGKRGIFPMNYVTQDFAFEAGIDEDAASRYLMDAQPDEHPTDWEFRTSTSSGGIRGMLGKIFN